MDLDVVRAAGERVMERGRFTAEAIISVPAAGTTSTSTYAVDLDRGLAQVSTTTTMAPRVGSPASWTPRSGGPVVHWIVEDRLLMQVPGDDGSLRWVSVAGAALLGGELSLLLWPAGVVEAYGPSGTSGVISAVVDVGEVVQRAPAEHARAAARSAAGQRSVATSGQVDVDITLDDGVLAVIETELPIDLDGKSTQRLTSFSVDQRTRPWLGEPPTPQEEVSAQEMARTLGMDPSGGSPWWTRTRPFRA